MNVALREGIAVATRHLSAQDYVQDGLVAMWDGIENAGWGVHNPNATIWKDLVGNIDLTVNLNTAKSGARRYRWTANSLHNYFSGGNQNASGAYAYGGDTASVPAIVSFEYVFNVNGSFTTSAGWVALYRGGQWSEIQPDKNRGHVSFAFGKPAYPSSATTFAGPRSFCVQYASATSLNIDSVYLDGVRCTLGSTGWPARHTLSHAIMLGYSSNLNSGYSCPIGDCFACRVYNRRLSVAEVESNHDVDKVRFELPS